MNRLPAAFSVSYRGPAQFFCGAHCDAHVACFLLTFSDMFFRPPELSSNSSLVLKCPARGQQELWENKLALWRFWVVSLVAPPGQRYRHLFGTVWMAVTFTAVPVSPKIDIDAPFHLLLSGMRRLLTEGAVRIISWEVDDSWFLHQGICAPVQQPPLPCTPTLPHVPLLSLLCP